MQFTIPSNILIYSADVILGAVFFTSPFHSSAIFVSHFSLNDLRLKPVSISRVNVRDGVYKSLGEFIEIARVCVGKKVFLLID